MAVDIYNAKEFNEKVQEIINKIGSLNFNIDKAKTKLDEQIAKVEKIQDQLLKRLNCKSYRQGGIEELNERLKELSNATINFSGARLNTIFTSAIQENNAINLDRFNKAVTIFIEKVVKSDSIMQQCAELSSNFLVAYLNKKRGTKQVRYSSSKGINIATGEYVPLSFTEEQKKAWKKIMLEYAREKSNNPWLKEKGAEEYIITKFTNENVIQTEIVDVFDWSGRTGGLTQKEAIEKFTLKNGNISKKLENINQKLKEGILQYVTQDKKLISSIIDHILSKNPFVFFVGKNSNDITGLLGEIQGIYYICKLLNKDATEINNSILWKGGTYTGETGSKPHQDILLDNLFGIQVKNTSREEAKDELLSHEYKVNFASAQIDTIIQKMKEIGLDDEGAELLKEYYAMLSFNVPYHFKGFKNKKIAVPGNKYYKNAVIWNEATRVYKGARGKLESREKNIQILLKSFAAALMYIDLSDNIKIPDRNVLFFIGAASAISAVEILEQIKEDIQNQNSYFQIERSSFENNYNIISAINNKQKNNTTNFGYNSILNTVLSSSYKF